MEMAEEIVKKKKKETAFLNVGIHMLNVNCCLLKEKNKAFLKYLQLEDKGKTHMNGVWQRIFGLF
jgi:hypothetical protein